MALPRPPRKLVAASVIALLSACGTANPPSDSTEAAVKGIEAAAVSSDGTLTVIGSIHHGGSLWRNQDGERLYNWNHTQGEYSTFVAADISPNGQWALTAAAHTLVLWSLKDGSSFRFWTAPAEILDLSLSRSGDLALLGTADHTAVVFDVQRGGIKRSFYHQNRVRSVDLSDDARFAITGSEDNTAVLWDMRTGEALQRIQHEDEVQTVALSPDGSLAFSAAKYDKAIIWNTSDGRIIGEIPLAAEKLQRGLRFTTARFSDNNRHLLTGRPDRLVQLWNVSDVSLAAEWSVPKRDKWKPTSASIVAVGFSGTGNYIAVASNGFIHQLKR